MAQPPPCNDRYVYCDDCTGHCDSSRQAVKKRASVSQILDGCKIVWGDGRLIRDEMGELIWIREDTSKPCPGCRNAKKSGPS